MNTLQPVKATSANAKPIIEVGIFKGAGVECYRSGPCVTLPESQGVCCPPIDRWFMQFAPFHRQLVPEGCSTGFLTANHAAAPPGYP